MAFMAQDGWKSGLTPVQLSKVEALQTDCERLQKEAAQKKLMVENQEQELERQKRKVNERNIQGYCKFCLGFLYERFKREFHSFKH